MDQGQYLCSILHTVADLRSGHTPGPISGERIMKQLSADAIIDVGKALNRNIFAATALQHPQCIKPIGNKEPGHSNAVRGEAQHHASVGHTKTSVVWS